MSVWVAVTAGVMLAGFLAPAEAAYRTGGVEKMILSNGLTLLVKREPDSRVAAIEIFARVGAADESESTAGIGHLLAGSVLAGTKTRSAAKLARLVSEVGGNFHAVWQWDYLEIYAVTLPQMCEDAISLLADSVRAASLEPAALEYARSAILRQSRAVLDDPYTSAYTTLNNLVHRRDPYGRPYLGTRGAVETVTQAQLETFYKKHFVPNNIVISVVGDVDPTSISRKILSHFRRLDYVPRRDEAANRRLEPGPSSPIGEVLAPVTESAATSYVMLGYPALCVTDPDYPALSVANVILGGGKSSLLFTKLREEKGLGYHVGSVYPVRRGNSHIAAFVGMDASRGGRAVVEVVKEFMLQQVAALANGRFSDEDVERAKKFLIGTHALRHERTRDRAFHLGWYEAIGLGYRYDFEYADVIRTVTRSDVERVCKRIFSQNPTVVVTGNTY